MELFDYWGEGDFPPPHFLLRKIAIFLGAHEPAGKKMVGSTPPQEIAAMVANPRGFGGAVLPLDQAPEWFKTSLAMWEASKEPS